MDGDDEANLPKPEECLRRCEMFASITNTDNALAMMFLQNRDWDLQLALSVYYENAELAEGNESGHGQFSGTMDSVIDLTSDNEEVMVVSSEDEVTEKFETTDHQHAHLFRLLSWNIDGLSKESLSFRTPEAINLILKEKFHVVCLQEVVPETLRSIKEKLKDLYKIFYPSRKGEYFPIICVLKHPGLSTVPNSFKVTEFESVMGRQLLSLDVDLDIPKLLPTNPCASRWNGHRAIRVRIFTSHLESCLDFASVRKDQLSLTWNAMQSALQTTSSNSASSPICALFCGDLNVRDKEIKDLGGLPAGMVDVWEVCGARPEARFTWDRSRNSNLSLDNHEEVDTRRFRGQRFDRMMLLCRGGGSLRPIDFELRGLERVPNRLHFPSDHWAILGHFDLEPPSSLPSWAAN